MKNGGPKNKRRTKVLIVDDSAVVRKALSAILGTDPDIEVLGTAADPLIAASKLRKMRPDVITLDIEMPRMDGLTFLKKLMAQHPIPVVICSSLAGKDCATSLRALELGAVEIICKPKLGTQQFIEESSVRICDAIKAAGLVVPGKINPENTLLQPRHSADAILSKGKAMLKTTDTVLVVGASTGGTKALEVFLKGLPLGAPGVLVVQHMPANFTKAFAERLNSVSAITIREAAEGDSIRAGLALIAPGNQHALLRRSGARYVVQLSQGPLVSRHRPSVDVLFRSAARYGGSNVIGVIMTGMGDDGARGMLELKQAGAHTIAQDEASCVVFGMPKEAIAHGGVEVVLPLSAIAPEIMRGLGANDVPAKRLTRHKA